MSTLLESHERDFASLMQDLQHKTQGIPDLSGGKTKTLSWF
jgi:hypothetical protein